MIKRLLNTTSLKANLVANFTGKIWTAGVGFIFVPFYIKFLGIESYGLVGFYGTLIGTMALLDFGLSTTLNRELASAKALNKTAAEIKNLVYTLEILYWSIGFLIGLAFFLLAPVIATHWVKAEKLSVDTITQAVRMMGIVIFFQWPISLYNGGLYGLERQVFDNILNVILSTIRAGGVVLLLWLVSPTITVFFTWQAIITGVYVLSMRYGLWHYLPESPTAKLFSKDQLKQIWRFAAGITGISLVSFFLGQLDKVVLSKLLPLSQYAYYTLAFAVASGISMIIGPINSATFPRMSSLVAGKNRVELIRFYHQTCKLVAGIVSIVGLFIIFFAKDILMFWLHNSETVLHTTTLVQIIVAGTLCNALMYIPYFMLLAHGNTKFTLIQNIIASVILVPLLFLLIHYYGAVGAAWVWFIVNLGYIIFSIPLLHKLILKGETQKWYIQDTLMPFIIPVAGFGLLKWAAGFYYSETVIPLIILVLIFVSVSVIALLVMPEIRLQLKLIWNRVNSNEQKPTIN